jgi:MerR family transcriptional regulator/heat shock protein HspR
MPHDVRTPRADGLDEPMYVISVAARLVEMHPQTLRYYERAGLVKPTRSRGRIRLYSQRDIDRLRKIARLTDELGVNLAGVEVILDLTEKLEEIQRELERHKIRLESDYTISNEMVTLSNERVEDASSPHRAQPTTSRPKTKATNGKIRRGR